MEYSNDPTQQGDTTQVPGAAGPTDAQLQAWFQQYYGRAGTEAELADLRGQPDAESRIFNSPEGIAYLNAQHPEYAGAKTTTTTDKTTSGGGGPSSSTTTIGSLTAPFTEPFNAPGNINQGGKPGLEFLPPTPEFKYPTYDDMLKDPGYQFRMQQGAQALEQSAAGRGVLNTGGTLKDILNYGQSAGSQEFGNMWNRNLDAYNAGWKNWQTLGQAGQRQSELNYDRSYQKWLQDYNIDRNQKNDTFDKTFKWTTA